MWFKSIKIVNVGPFKERAFEFPRGSIGVFGPNGCGKSTMINLMYGLLTNDFGRFDGLKSDMVRNTSADAAPSYVTGEVIHNGISLLITRNFKPSKTNPNTTLVVDKSLQITDANKAEAKLVEILGVDNTMLDSYVFKEQSKIYDFITSKPAERADAYAALCRTEVCSEIYDIFGKFLNENQELKEEIIDDSDVIAHEIAQLKLESSNMDKRITDARESLLSDKKRGIYEEQVQTWHQLETLQAEQKKLTDSVSALKSTLTEKKAQYEKASEDYNKVSEACSKRAAKAQDYRAALKAIESYRKYAAQRKQLEEERDSLAKQTRSKPSPVDDSDKIELLKEKLTRLSDELVSANKVIKIFDDTGTTECPTCQTSVKHLDAHLKSLRARASELPDQIRRLRKKIEQIDAFIKETRAYDKWQVGYDAKVKANAASLKATVSVALPEGDVDEIKTWLESFDAMLECKDDLDEKLRTAADQRTRAKAKYDQAKERLQEVSDAIAGIELDKEAVIAATDKLRLHQQASEEIASLNGEQRGIARQIEAKQTDLKKLRNKIRKRKKLKAMASTIADARAVVHRSRLPKRVALANLMRMEGSINENLKLFGEPFWVEADDSLSFIVHKPGEPPQKAGRLSTGQRIVLALAFWPAVASLWATELGMLVLDEPTANLDGDNRKYLGDALSLMTAKVRGNRQLIMVTHDHDLKSAFDMVIDLGG